MARFIPSVSLVECRLIFPPKQPPFLQCHGRMNTHLSSKATVYHSWTESPWSFDLAHRRCKVCPPGRDAFHDKQGAIGHSSKVSERTRVELPQSELISARPIQQSKEKLGTKIFERNRVELPQWEWSSGRPTQQPRANVHLWSLVFTGWSCLSGIHVG